MSREAVVTFLRKVVEDPDLQEEVATLARARGFDFAGHELDEESLEKVAGGVTFAGADGEAQDARHENWVDLLPEDDEEKDTSK